MLILRQQIASLIPHGEAMCLLDQVTDWDAHHLNAITESHRRADNPLFESERMDTVALVEYGAQAAAIHAALQQSGLGAARPAYLGAIKKLRLYSQYVDTGVAELQIEAQCIFSDNNGAIYDIWARAGGNDLISGRIVLVLPS